MPAAILAGGKSRRMGSNKAFLPLGGEPVVAHVARILSDIFREVFVVANSAAPFQGLGLTVIPDILPGNDSLGGLHAAVEWAGDAHVFVVGCDMPFLQPAFLRGMAARAEGWDVVIPIRNGFPEPLCAFYRGSCAPAIRAQIEAGRLKMIGFHDMVHVLHVEEKEWRRWDSEGRSFWNLNTPEEYEAARNEEAGS